ncbi:MAG: phosphoribosylanthranilate isomerase [Candidatus Omnitrophota bacterium]
MTKVKICGITNREDAEKAYELGADFIGFIFAEKSSRRINPEAAQKIIAKLPKELPKVGLFLNQDLGEVMRTAKDCAIDIIQLHGDEDPHYCESLKREFRIIKVFKIKDTLSAPGPKGYEDVDYYLFDTYVKDVDGGTGVSFNWDILRGKEFEKPIFLAGGLTPLNVTEAISVASPYAVDVTSGVERSCGKKDHKLLKEFIDNAKKAKKETR